MGRILASEEHPRMGMGMDIKVIPSYTPGFLGPLTETGTAGGFCIERNS